jgi:hypothetical protein
MRVSTASGVVILAGTSGEYFGAGTGDWANADPMVMAAANPKANIR